MSLSIQELEKMLEVLRATRPVEIDCDAFLMLVGEFAEAQVVGKPIPEAMKVITEHLDLCAECREEYELLLETIGN